VVETYSSVGASVRAWDWDAVLIEVEGGCCNEVCTSDHFFAVLREKPSVAADGGCLGNEFSQEFCVVDWGISPGGRGALRQRVDRTQSQSGYDGLGKGRKHGDYLNA
jgi:hypothetical protein